MFFKQIISIDKPNSKWNVLHQTGALTIRNNRIFRLDHGFFTIGSCFAEEIRKALTARKVRCYPEYRRIDLDPDRVMVDTLPHREHMNYYNTFSIRQEMERAAGLWVQDRWDIWKIAGRDIRKGVVVHGEGEVYQDPYRRMVMGKTPEDLWRVLDQVNLVMKEGITQADACIITLGTTEVFRKRNNGLICNQLPVYGGGAGLKETYFHPSTFDENLNNMRVALRLMKELNPRVQVVLTVSPVPLARSFREHDIFVNNMESKCTLRAVAGQICRELDWVHYFPSFEIVLGIGAAAYQERDMLHVKEEVVGMIIDQFLTSHFEAGLSMVSA